MNISNLLGSLEKELTQIEQFIIADIQTHIPLLTQVTEHVLRSGGKRLRPAIVILAAHLFEASEERVFKTAQVLEYLHTATLLHDDVVDNAETRRYQQTACRIWGNEASVLAGDYLFAMTFHSLVQLHDLAILQVMSDTTTLMAKGELLQLSRTWETMDEATYLEIIFNKTACLFAAAAKMGALLGKASTEDADQLYQYGSSIGMAFQIVDDILDYMVEEAQTGKPIGIDLKEKKITLPLNHLLTHADAKDQELIRSILSQSEINEEHLHQIVELMSHYESLPYSFQIAQRYVQEAHGYLETLPPSPTRTTLKEIADFIVDRRI